MRLLKALSILVALTPLQLFAQITINNSDLPAAGDTFRVSNVSIVTPVDLTLTGANHTWDFSGFVPVDQTVDSFTTVASTGLIYSLFFSFGQNAANIVQKGPVIPAVPGFTVSNVNAFFNKSSSNYKQVGLGAELNGLSTPLAFNNHDFVYNFPLEYADQDSCDSDYSLSLPGLGSYDAVQKRVNNVDGWGTVITPFGIYNALRVVTELSGTDSLYLDTLGMGFNVPRPLTREYKWLAQGEGVPVMQINTQFVGSLEQIIAIRYKDSLSTSGLVNGLSVKYQSVIYPNPSVGVATLRGSMTGSGRMELLLTDVSGRALGSTWISREELQNGVNLESRFHAGKDGIYLLHLRGNQGTEILRWVRNR